jgi:two-component system sensor kinase FixL
VIIADPAKMGLEGRLVQVARLAAIAEMASAMAHEINQPLAAIATYAAALQRIISSPDAPLEPARDIAREIAAQALRAGNILNRMREIVRHSGVDLQLISCSDTVRDLLVLAEPLARAHRITIDLQLTEHLPKVRADPLQLQLLLLSVVHNAIDAIETHHPDDRRITIGSRLAAPTRLELSVADTGGGIADELRERLFQPFVTTKPNGTGLGLLACQRIAHAMGGDFGFDSRPGAGSVFYVRIPVA